MICYFLSNNHCPIIKWRLGSKRQLHLDSGLIAQLPWAKVKDDGKGKKNYSKKDLEQLKSLLWNNMDSDKEPLAWKRKSCLCFGLSRIRGQENWRVSCFMWQLKFFQEQENTVKPGTSSPTTKQSWEHSDMTRLLGIPLDLTGESPSRYLSDEGIQAIKFLASCHLRWRLEITVWDWKENVIEGGTSIMCNWCCQEVRYFDKQMKGEKRMQNRSWSPISCKVQTSSYSYFPCASASLHEMLGCLLKETQNLLLYQKEQVHHTKALVLP